jgi:tRNA (pseudouridine54-N1)-methyltransferase
MDEVARSVSTAFTVSNDLRRDTEFTILFVTDPLRGRRIALSGARLRFLNPDERSTAALLKNALVRSAAFTDGVEVSPGLTVGPVEALGALEAFLKGPGALWLHEQGSPLSEWAGATEEFSAVLSDPLDPLPAEVAVLEASGAAKLSVGPRSLRASQVIDIVHNEFDRREASRGAGSVKPSGR